MVVYSGWGTGSWGLGPWGLGGPTPTEIASAFALSERTFRVSLSLPALAVSPIVIGDALDPRTWGLTRLDTNEQIIILAVNKVDSSTFDFYTLEKLGNSLVTHEISSSTLISESGVPVPSATTGEFLGCEKVKVTRSPVALIDTRNASQSETEIGGTLQIGADGDYEVEGGASLLKKLVIRRLVTTPGEFFYLTQYGIGFRSKEPLPNTDFVRLRAAVEQQLQREPEFSKVQVRLALSAQNVLTVEVRARVRRTNEEVVIPIAAQGSMVVL